MMKNTHIFFIDALKPSYITKANMPYLHSIMSKYTALPIKTLLGYSSGIHPAIWTGTKPEVNNKWNHYYFNKNSSQFNWTKKLRFAPYPIRLALKKIMLILGKDVGFLPDVPIKVHTNLSYDDLSLDSITLPTLFDLLLKGHLENHCLHDFSLCHIIRDR